MSTLRGNWWLAVVNVIGVACYGSLARLAYRHLRYLSLEIRPADHNAAYARIMREQRAADILAGQVNRQGHTQQQAAIGRAWATLYGYLSESEQEQLAEHGFFDVPSKLTVGRIYRIPASEGVVTVLDDDKRVMTICVRPEDSSVPWPDVMLSYKLGLQADEERWLETANKWPMVQPQGQEQYGTMVEGIQLTSSEQWRNTQVNDLPDMTVTTLFHYLTQIVDGIEGFTDAQKQYLTPYNPEFLTFEAWKEQFLAAIQGLRQARDD